jgi:hypothetical protein
MLRRRGRPPARYDDGERGGARVRVSSRAAQEAEPVSPFRAFSSLANFPGPNFFGWVSDPVGGRTGTVVGAWKGRKLSAGHGYARLPSWLPISNGCFISKKGICKISLFL